MTKVYIDPILEEWASNNLLSYGIMLLILSGFKIIFHWVTIILNEFFRDTLKRKTCVPDSVTAFRAFVDTFTIFVGSLFAIMGATIPVTSFMSLGLFIIMTSLQSIIQTWSCMRWMLLDDQHAVYPLIEVSLDLPIGIIQLLGFTVATPLAYREYLIFIDNSPIRF